ncbi:S-formylglutathione hydrolase [Nymphon striatum]|nr:S-formylglutathione hydrolase [Nymphon striatum]
MTTSGSPFIFDIKIPSPNWISSFLRTYFTLLCSDMSAVKEISSERSFGGHQKVFEHESDVLKCKMKFSLYLPTASENGKVPVIYWLSGSLTCTEQNFIQKSGFQKYASKHGFAVVCPDTSPRGCNIEGEDDSYDFGSGAGFYVDATQDKWKKNYNMYSYVTRELPDLINSKFAVDGEKQSIMGHRHTNYRDNKNYSFYLHSMGGHGALICFMKNPGKYLSVSAFAPICNPVECAWGKKAFSGYLGDNQDDWKEYDSCSLIKQYNGPPLHILIDQGKADSFLHEDQLLPDNLVKAALENKQSIVLRMQEV